MFDHLYSCCLVVTEKTQTQMPNKADKVWVVMVFFLNQHNMNQQFQI